MLTIHQSNRLERLADVLAELIRPPLRAPLEAERVVVPNLGMARWLSLELATRVGVCANVEFALPGKFVWELSRSVLANVPDETELSVAVMTWRLFDAMCAGDATDGALASPSFAPVRAYLSAETSPWERSAVAPRGCGEVGAADPSGRDDARCFALAEQIARVFDQYLVYRADMIRAWESGRALTSRADEVWQAELWRRIHPSGRERHRARSTVDLAEALARGDVRGDLLPARLAIFGMPSLAPIHLEAFTQLGRHTDVHLLVLNPCREHWSYIVAPRAAAHLARGGDPAELYLEPGNDLLASMGLQGRDLIDRITEIDSALVFDRFETPSGTNLLDHLQSDILHLRRRSSDASANGDVAAPLGIAAADRSVQVHVCHSRMREVEVLHDQLLDLFERDPSLEPSDVRVMVPEIQAYAPLIDAIFAAAPQERRIPYAIADQHARTESPIADAFLTLLALPEGRYEAPQVLGLLEVEALRERFDITAAEVPRLAAWTREAGIRWGADAAGRAALGLPAIHEGTWRFGLDRMLLGYAMASSGGARMYAGMVPHEAAAGTQSELLAGLHRFAQAVLTTADALTGERTLTEWQAALGALLDRFFSSRHGGEELLDLRAALAAVTADAASAGVGRPVSLAIVRAALEPHLEATRAQWALLSGRVTFCTLVPMRNIPAQVVCLLGMNDGEFPRMRRAPGFDLMAGDPRPGDRSRRDDDRYLFLDALLSARRCLYVSYVGRGVRDDQEIPPSVLVSELLEAIDAGFAREGEKKSPDEGASAAAVTRHPLHAFSRKYFEGREPGLFSYSTELCAAAEQRERALAEPPATPRPFARFDLREPDAEWRTIDVDRLVSFFRHPTRYFLRDRLGIELLGAQDVAEGSEIFDPVGLDVYQIREEILARRVAQEVGVEDLLALLRARGALPHGENAAAWLEQHREPLEEMAARVRDLREPPAQRLAVDLRVGAFRIVGALSDLGPHGVVMAKAGTKARKSVDGRDVLELWLRHLILCATRPEAGERRSRLVTPDPEVGLTIAACAAPEAHLATLLDLYWRGLHRPLPLLPRSSYAHWQKLARDATGARVLGAPFGPIEADLWDDYYVHAFGPDLIALDGAEIAAVARSVFAPIDEHVSAASGSRRQPRRQEQPKPPPPPPSAPPPLRVVKGGRGRGTRPGAS